MKLKQSFLTLLISISFTLVMGQSKTFDNVLKIELRSSVSIENNKQIVGYAFFYKIDKVKKGNLYRLVIMDENLKEIGNNEFEGGKELVLLKAVYESERLMLSFYDKNKFEDYKDFVKVFDLKGKLKGTVGYDPEKVKTGLYGKQLSDMNESLYNGFENIEGKGFVRLYQSMAKRGGADIQFIDLNGKLKWEQNLTADKGDRMDTYIITTTPNTILLFQMDREGPMRADGKVFLVGLETTKGKQIFKTSMEINGYSYEPLMCKKTEEGKIILVASLIKEEDKILKSNPVGFSICELNDQTGEMKVVKDFVFAKDLAGVINMKTDAKTEEGFIKPHDLIFMNDGSMVFVGEFFRKTVSALGVAVKIAGGNASAAQATIDDMFLMRINKDMQAVALEKVEKDKTRWQLPGEMMSVGLMNRYLTWIGMFGYLYTDEGMDGSQKTVIARGTFQDEKFGTVAISINENQGFTQKRFSIPKEKNVSYWVMRGKPGYVLITKYNSKAKTFDVNLEKTN